MCEHLFKTVLSPKPTIKSMLHIYWNSIRKLLSAEQKSSMQVLESSHDQDHAGWVVERRGVDASIEAICDDGDLICLNLPLVSHDVSRVTIHSPVVSHGTGMVRAHYADMETLWVSTSTSNRFRMWIWQCIDCLLLLLLLHLLRSEICVVTSGHLMCVLKHASIRLKASKERRLSLWITRWWREKFCRPRVTFLFASTLSSHSGGLFGFRSHAGCAPVYFASFWGLHACTLLPPP